MDILDDGWAVIIEGLTGTEPFDVLDILGGGSGEHLVACGCHELNCIAADT